jgi:HK97 family phage prohead protease
LPEEGEGKPMLAPLDKTNTLLDLHRRPPLIAPDGGIEGYASLFGEVDQARDMVMPGAFAASLRQRGVRRVPMLFQHDPTEPIGVWLELREDLHGLYARGRLIPEVVRARELLALLKAGAADGLSIGFRTVKGRVDPKSRIRKLDAIDLWEISLVTFPLLAGARVRVMKESRLASRPLSLNPCPPPAGGGGQDGDRARAQRRSARCLGAHVPAGAAVPASAAIPFRARGGRAVLARPDPSGKGPAYHCERRARRLVRCLRSNPDGWSTSADAGCVRMRTASSVTTSSAISCPAPVRRS